MKVELLFADVTYLCLITVFLPITMYAIAIVFILLLVVVIVFVVPVLIFTCYVYWDVFLWTRRLFF